MNSHSLSQLFGKIGEKGAKEWLESNGYEVHSFQEIAWKISLLELTIRRLKRRKKVEYIEGDKIHIKMQEDVLKNIFGKKFEEMRKFYKEYCLLTREVEKIRQEKNFRRRGVGPDFIVKRNNDIGFVEVKVNEAELTKYQKICFKIAKGYGFKTMVVRVKVEINISRDICITEFS